MSGSISYSNPTSGYAPTTPSYNPTSPSFRPGTPPRAAGPSYSPAPPRVPGPSYSPAAAAAVPLHPSAIHGNAEASLAPTLPMDTDATQLIPDAEENKEAGAVVVVRPEEPAPVKEDARAELSAASAAKSAVKDAAKDAAKAAAKEAAKARKKAKKEQQEELRRLYNHPFTVRNKRGRDVALLCEELFSRDGGRPTSEKEYKHAERMIGRRGGSSRLCYRPQVQCVNQLCELRHVLMGQAAHLEVVKSDKFHKQLREEFRARKELPVKNLTTEDLNLAIMRVCHRCLQARSLMTSVRLGEFVATEDGGLRAQFNEPRVVIKKPYVRAVKPESVAPAAAPAAAVEKEEKEDEKKDKSKDKGNDKGNDKDKELKPRQVEEPGHGWFNLFPAERVEHHLRQLFTKGYKPKAANTEEGDATDSDAANSDNELDRTERDRIKPFTAEVLDWKLMLKNHPDLLVSALFHFTSWPAAIKRALNEGSSAEVSAVKLSDADYMLNPLINPQYATIKAKTTKAKSAESKGGEHKASKKRKAEDGNPSAASGAAAASGNPSAVAAAPEKSDKPVKKENTEAVSSSSAPAVRLGGPSQVPAHLQAQVQAAASVVLPARPAPISVPGDSLALLPPPLKRQKIDGAQRVQTRPDDSEGEASEEEGEGEASEEEGEASEDDASSTADGAEGSSMDD